MAIGKITYFQIYFGKCKSMKTMKKKNQWLPGVVGEEGWPGTAQRIFRAPKILCVSLYDRYISLYICLNLESIQHQEWTNVNHEPRLWYINADSSDGIVYHSGGEYNNGRDYTFVGVRVYGRPLYFPLNFTVKLKQLLKK